MKSNRYFRWVVALTASLLTGAGACAAEAAATAKTYRAAVFVVNHSGAAAENKIEALEDYVVSRVTDLGVNVISSETAAKALSSLGQDGVDSALDKSLAQSSTALRLSQNLGADYLLHVTISGYETQLRALDAYGVKSINEDRTLRVTYRILDGQTGASLTADTVKVNKLVQQTAHAAEVSSGVLDGLLDQAAVKIAESLKSRIDAGRIASATTAPALVSVTLNTEAADLAIPDVRISADNVVAISDGKLKVSALAATVEVDGVAVGSAPGQLTVRPGLSKLRITREGCKPYERTVNFMAGQTLTVALQLSDEGYARWKDATQFLNELKNGAKLTDGEVKVLEGRAKMLEQSGFKVNTTDAPQVTINNFSATGVPVDTGNRSGRSLFSY